MTEPNDEPSTAALMLNVLESMTDILTATAGYRAKCLAEDFSEGAAEQMAIMFHAYLMSSLMMSGMKS